MKTSSIQNGSALIVGLVFLMVMTMLGLTAMQSTGMQERMAGNLRDRTLAFQAAEAALRAGETWLQVPANTAASELAAPLPGNLLNWGDSASDPRNGTVTSFDDSQLASDPFFIVGRPQGVRVGVTMPPQYRWIYPIASRGAGGTEDAVVILQSMFEP